ncbi:hypothetical protein BpHYR1_043587 [Brachionus plicatilis]|uniref:Uncharacterized protein n=1 Tax=Brachionus plicatilis TaxID=10195 RepID=A0A3M7SZY4_BRAPC|nr:hypothetical protein BpHYR1_043587 [Brachionus plicatilis]
MSSSPLCPPSPNDDLSTWDLYSAKPSRSKSTNLSACTSPSRMCTWLNGRSAASVTPWGGLMPSTKSGSWLEAFKLSPYRLTYSAGLALMMPKYLKSLFTWTCGACHWIMTFLGLTLTASGCSDR